MDYGLEIARIFFYLLLVLGIIYVSQHFMRKFLKKQRVGKHLELVEQLYISPKVSLGLVRAKNTIILLSFSDKGIEKLKSWPLEEFGDELSDSENDSTKFSDYLKDMVGKYRRDQDE